MTYETNKGPNEVTFLEKEDKSMKSNVFLVNSKRVSYSS